MPFADDFAGAEGPGFKAEEASVEVLELEVDGEGGQVGDVEGGKA